MKYIHQHNLDTIKILIHEDYEMCGEINVTSHGGINLVEINKGEKIKNNEGTCKPADTELEWHTHPAFTYGFPSFQDIFRVIGTETPTHLSIIFSTWGIWEVFTQHKIDWKILKDHEADYFGRLQQDFIKSKDQLQFINIFINAYMEKFHAMGFNMTFTPWNKVNDKYKLKTIN